MYVTDTITSDLSVPQPFAREKLNTHHVVVLTDLLEFDVSWTHLIEGKADKKLSEIQF